MDNLELVELPSNVLPRVEGKKAVICKTPNGFLYCVTASGATRLMTVDETFAINDHAIQFYGERPPAERYGGTWEIDATYAGRVIIGSGGSYEFGATGGNDSHMHTADNMNALWAVSTNSNQIHYVMTNVEAWSNNVKNRSVNLELLDDGGTWGEGVKVIGTTNASLNIPPYAVVNFWKRVA